MLETFNIRDSYTDYRKNLLKNRLKVIQDITRDKTVYERLPIKLIERKELKHNIVPEVKDPGITIYINIVHGYLKYLIEKIIEGHDVKLGAKLGIITVRGTKVKASIDSAGKIKGLAPDWSKTRVSWLKKAKELGLTWKEYIEKVPKHERQVLYCFNEHSDYIRYKFTWFKKNVVVKNKTIYSFILNRANKLMLHQAIMEGKEYLVNTQKQ